MRKMIQRINTLLVVCWFMGTAMWMGGEPRGSFIGQIAVGFISFALAYIFGKELAKRNLLITAENDDNDKY